MAQRKAGPLIKYKEFANNVKRRMFKDYARSVPLLLDLGCGRGGDISKWRDAGVGHVLAMDLSAEQLQDARRRERDGGRECERRVFTLGGQSARRKKTERRRLLIPDTLHAPSVSATSQGSRQVTADARVDLRALA